MRGKSIGSRFLNVKLKREASVTLLGKGAWTGSWSLIRVLGSCDPHRARLCSYPRSRKGDAVREGWPREKRGRSFLFQLLFWRNSTACFRMSSVFFKGLFKKLYYCWFSLSFGNFIAGGRLGRNVSQKAFLPRLVFQCARVHARVRAASGRPWERSRRTGLRTGLLKPGSE